MTRLPTLHPYSWNFCIYRGLTWHRYAKCLFLSNHSSTFHFTSMKNILITQTQTRNVPISTTILSTTIVISNIVVVSTTKIPPILVGIQLNSVSKIPSSLVVMGITLVFKILGIAGFIPPWKIISIGFYPPKRNFISFDFFSFSFYLSWIFPWQYDPNEYIVERSMTFVRI